MEEILIILKQSWEVIKPVLEIGIIAFIFYYIVKDLMQSRAYQILFAIGTILIVLTTISMLLDFEVISTFLETIWTAILAIFIVIFQPELRRALALLGGSTKRTISHKEKKEETVNEIVKAVKKMSEKKIGALILFERENNLLSIVNSHISLSAKVKAELLETIFFPNTALHDGGLIIHNDKIIAAHAILPLSKENLKDGLGTRHRAALGITEESDAIALIVSEETGIISIACQAKLKRHIKADKLGKYLNRLLFTSEDINAVHNNIFDSMIDNENAFATVAIQKENKNND